MQQLELFPDPELNPPSLEQLFHILNRRHWNGRLPFFRCEWSDRMITTWGCCYRGRRLIRISSLFRTRPIRELEALMCHEMIHIKYRGHGKRFKNELKRIGLKGDVQRIFPHLNELTKNHRDAKLRASAVKIRT
jgi:hypothetical protein